MGESFPTTVLELTALRVQPGDADVQAAFERATGIEGEPVDDGTWKSMVALAQQLAAGNGDAELKQDRAWDSVQASAGVTMVDVRWHGQAAHLYFTTQPGSEQEFSSLLRRLRSAGFTVVQGSAMTEVTPDSSLADLVAKQEAEQRGE